MNLVEQDCERGSLALLVSPQWSGPNMMVYGVDAWKPSRESSSEAVSSLRYAPPHWSPAVKGYW